MTLYLDTHGGSVEAALTGKVQSLATLARVAATRYLAVATDYGPAPPEEREAFGVMVGAEVRLDRARWEVAASGEKRSFVLKDLHSRVCGRVAARSHNDAMGLIAGRRDVYFVKDVLANVTRQACVYTEAELANQ